MAPPIADDRRGRGISRASEIKWRWEIQRRRDLEKGIERCGAVGFGSEGERTSEEISEP